MPVLGNVDLNSGWGNFATSGAIREKNWPSEPGFTAVDAGFPLLRKCLPGSQGVFRISF